MKLRITTKFHNGEEYTGETTLENVLDRLMNCVYEKETGIKAKHTIEIIKED